MGDDLAAADGPQALLALVAHDPGRATATLEELLRRSRRQPTAPRAEWRRLLALAHLRAGRPADGLRAARHALTEAARHGSAVERARTQTTYASALSIGGRHARALALATASIRALRGRERAEALVELGLVHRRAGDLAAALRVSDAASRALARHGCRTPAAGARLNCAVLHMQRGDPQRALRDLDAAEALVAAGADLPRWLLDVNRAHALALRGDAVRAVALFDEAAELMRPLGHRPVQLDLDQLHALLAAGASLEVLQRTATLRADRRLRGRERGEVDLLAALAARQRLDWAGALARARAARRAFRRGGEEHGWARAVAVQAEVALVGGSPPPPRRVVEAAERAAAVAGDRSLAARLVAIDARIAMRAGRPARPLPRQAGAALDATAGIAVAVARVERAAASRSGRRLVHELSRLVTARAELARRAALPQTPNGPSTGFADAGSIALRAALARADPALLARVTALVRALAVPAATPAPGAIERAAPADLRVDFAAVGGDVWRIVTVGRRAWGVRVHEQQALAHVARLSRSERALALRPRRRTAPDADALPRLDALLFAGGDLAEREDEGRLLISFPTTLSGVPWAALPSLARQPWAIAVPPAAADGATAAPDPPVRVLVGPHLPNGSMESDAVARCYTASRLFAGPAATASNVRQSLATRGVVHIAAHAGRRGDDPTLSWIELADGPLTCRDLLGATVHADCVVLAACDSASSAGDCAAGAVTPANTLMSTGARSVIAASEPVEHASTTDLLAVVHRELADGVDPALALQRARAALASAGAAGSFVCLLAA